MTLMTRPGTCLCMVAALTLTAAAPAAGPLTTRPDDFEQFWQRSAAQRTSLAPSTLKGTCAGAVMFPVTETDQAQAHYWPGGPPGVLTPIVYLYEPDGPALCSPAGAGRAHLSLPWRDGAGPLHEWYLDGLPDRDAASLRRAVLTACQAVDLVRTCPSVQAPRVGLIGDGFGATVALAAAALMPEQAAFLIAHQPRPAYHCLPDGALTSCPAVRDVLARIKSERPPGSHGTISRTLRYFDAINFAPLVKAPTLFIAGDADREAPLPELLQLYDCLLCERELIVLEGLGHCASASLPIFPDLVRRWLARVEGGRVPTACDDSPSWLTSP